MHHFKLTYTKKYHFLYFFLSFSFILLFLIFISFYTLLSLSQPVLQAFIIQSTIFLVGLSVFSYCLLLSISVSCFQSLYLAFNHCLLLSISVSLSVCRFQSLSVSRFQTLSLFLSLAFNLCLSLWLFLSVTLNLYLPLFVFHSQPVSVTVSRSILSVPHNYRMPRPVLQ